MRGGDVRSLVEVILLSMLYIFILLLSLLSSSSVGFGVGHVKMGDGTISVDGKRGDLQDFHV